MHETGLETFKVGNIRINVTLKRFRLTTISLGKQYALHIVSVCVCVSVTLVTQHARRIRRIILSPVTCLALLYFFTLSYKRHDFRGRWVELVEPKMCFDI